MKEGRHQITSVRGSSWAFQRESKVAASTFFSFFGSQTLIKGFIKILIALALRRSQSKG